MRRRCPACGRDDHPLPAEGPVRAKHCPHLVAALRGDLEHRHVSFLAAITPLQWFVLLIGALVLGGTFMAAVDFGMRLLSALFEGSAN